MNKDLNFIIRFWHFLTLKTFHNNLLTSGGSTYLTVISFIMILAAISEGFAWGFLGSTFTPETPKLGWFALGSFVFLLMWFFDRSLASADLLKNEHEKTLSGLEKDSLSIGNFLKNSLPFIARFIIVLLSLYITAPFLTQLVFKADIENKMLEQYKDNVVLARENGLKVRDVKIAKLEQLVNNTNDKLQKEIGGRSGTGYGYGSVAKSIERQLSTIESDLKITRIERDNFLTKFDQAVDRGNEEELKKYGITIAKDSPIFRQQAIDEFKSQPAFQNTNRAVHIFLFILGFILILAKIMQPRTLQMYFSNRLQEKWALYKLGTFDKYLPEQERSTLLLQTNYSIPEEFEDIMIQYSKEQRQRKQEELDMIQETQRLEREKEQERLNEEKKLIAKKKFEAERYEKEQEILKNSHQVQLERLAKEKSKIELREKSRVFYETQILNSLQEIDEAEQNYLNTFGEKIKNLENLEKSLIEELHEAERTYKNHEENIHARTQRIQSAENDLIEMQKLANQLHSRGDNHTIETLRAFTTAESAVVDQKSYIKNLKAALLTFETDQKYFTENLARIRLQLSKTQNQLEELNEPLDLILTVRSKIELRKMTLLRDEGLADMPYEDFDENEMPILVEKLKQQLSTHAPTYQVN